MNRHHYDSLSLELFPIYSCPRHHIQIAQSHSVAPPKLNSPRRLVRFSPDGSFIPIKVSESKPTVKTESDDSGLVIPLSFDESAPSSSTVDLVSDAKPTSVVKGAVFRHVPFKTPAVPTSASVVFTNSA